MIQVSIADLVACPQDFDGRRVRVAGTYMCFHENQCLDDTPEEWESEQATQEEDGEESCCRVWVETDEKTEWVGVKREFGVYVRVVGEGVYRHGACGHLGMYPGKLIEVSRVMAV
jgi:hypothetical protein